MVVHRPVKCHQNRKEERASQKTSKTYFGDTNSHTRVNLSSVAFQQARLSGLHFQKMSAKLLAEKS